jgi:hypothetical protein
MLVETLRKLDTAYGGTFSIPRLTDPSNKVRLDELAHGLAGRLISIFTRGADGRRPAFGSVEKFQSDPHWRDHLLFHEYFHADTGAGLGANHQTGWTALVASLIDEWRK